jgi:hypothetical protein
MKLPAADTATSGGAENERWKTWDCMDGGLLR